MRSSKQEVTTNTCFLLKQTPAASRRSISAFPYAILLFTMQPKLSFFSAPPHLIFKALFQLNIRVIVHLQNFLGSLVHIQTFFLLLDQPISRWWKVYTVVILYATPSFPMCIGSWKALSNEWIGGDWPRMIPQKFTLARNYSTNGDE